jgi:hypothetical protein
MKSLYAVLMRSVLLVMAFMKYMLFALYRIPLHYMLHTDMEHALSCIAVFVLIRSSMH